MRKRREQQPRFWRDILSETGEVVGSFSVNEGWITVRRKGGGEKEAKASHGGADEGLARLILSEIPSHNV